MLPPMVSAFLPAIARRTTLLAALGLLAACSSPPPATFDLSAAPHPGGVGDVAQTAVAVPTAVQLIDTDRIVVRSPGNQVAYLPGAQWPDRAPNLFQARLIQSFENASKSRRISRPGDRIVPSNQLNTDLRTFEVQTETREAVVEVTARIVADRTGGVGAARLFAARVPVSEITGPAAAIALNQAAQQVMADIVRWVAARS